MDRQVEYTTNTNITSNQDAVVSHGGAHLRLMGYAAREDSSAGAASSFDIVDGATGSGTAMVPVEMGSNGSKSEWFGPDGVKVKSGNLSINVISGEVDVVLYWRIS